MYRPVYGDRSGRWHRDHDRDHDRDRRRGPWFSGLYGYGYPGYGAYPYPFVIDPGFFDWSISGGTDYGAGYGASNGDGYGTGAPAQSYADLAPYPNQNDEPAQEAASTWQPPSTARPQYAGSAAASAPPPLQSLTVIFKNGRASETMQNYMVSSRALTNLDQQHYEQIPLDEIDIAATKKTNRARGLDFQVPAGSR